MTGERTRILALALASPLVFLSLCEILLRAGGFEYRPYTDEFEITPEYRIFERQGDDLVTRPQKRGSFPEQRFPAVRQPGELRVFLLGGSSVHRLEEAPRLRERLAGSVPPGTRVTLVNVGGNGYGTTRLRLHFQEILAYDPDVIVVYSGHNEFNEKFFRETLYAEHPLSALDEWLLGRSRVYQLTAKGMHQLVRANVEAIRRKRHPFFPPHFELDWDQTYDKGDIHEAYEENLHAMATLAAETGVPLLFSTVAYNRLAPPFQPDGDGFNRCLYHLDRAREPEALRRCTEEAIEDGLHPIRATEATNAIVRRVAQRRGIPLVDVDARIVAASRDGIPDFDLFDDHCHLNERGNAILQDALFEGLAAHGLLPRGADPPRPAGAG